MTKGDVTESPDTDEDSINPADDTPESLSEPIIEFSKRIGRPPGTPKTGGAVAGEVPSKGSLKDLIRFHRDVVEGKSVRDPSGTKRNIRPTLRERQHSADALTKLLELAQEQKAEAKAAQGIGRGHHNPPAAAAAD
jgi:hypothetical protein